MENILEKLNSLIWGAPALVMILGIGAYLCLGTRFAQFRFFGKAAKAFFQKLGRKETSKDGVTPFQALCTALAATVGTGNLAGVAGAIAIGGPGTIFWMWICALLGMVTKFAEATLAVRYRVREKGEFVGGPMYMIREGMNPKWHWLGGVYSFFGIVAAFGVGNAVQISTAVSGIHALVGGGTRVGDLLIGVGLAAGIGCMLFGGAKRIAGAALYLVPFAAALYRSEEHTSELQSLS